MLETAKRRRAMGVLALLATLVTVVVMALPASADAGDFEAQFVAKINALRASKGLSQLTVDPELTTIARNWSAKMAAAGQISHNPAFGSQVTQDWQKLGENVGVGPTVDSLFDAFVASPHHYENLVDPAWTKIGVGVVLVGNTIYTSHQFMQLRTARVTAPAPAPAPAPAVRRAQATAPRPLPAPAPVATPAPQAPPAPAAQLVGVLEQLHELDQLAA